ncbi:cyclopropane-fatty-acyl-phospholipid synthase [Actinomadura sp. CNU-125]|uniref:SAM-dependent methyltransferase n=1 Tax=Actinomadura sp. CNU-125 TaxID=1904961 RepID=UPI00095D991C|nr:cyclopropane-fatty-acyl-phospholipid synthase family protein [Actinomadura sp. CNU-125]OLT20847.1 cyclopropane-fatty-acyl-phospholipid synthase [Actinomadura sp. CNU-125]
MSTRIGIDPEPSHRSAGAAEAIRHHYDAGNDFFALWLDPSMTYSGALRQESDRDDGDDTLEAAQERKLRFHLAAVRADRAQRLLDIGCGWGSTLERFAALPGARHAVGLTLSDAQAEYIRSRAPRGVEVRIQDWKDYAPSARFDAIISIGAFEHFARPEDTPADKIELYRDFFTRCRSWLADGGTMSLQTIAYGNMRRESASRFFQQEIFPDADLPRLTEVTAALDGVFEIQSMRNDRLDYAWTCEQWARRLRWRRSDAVRLVGPEVVARYERYLKMSALGFRMGKICLLRMVLEPYKDGYFAGREGRPA